MDVNVDFFSCDYAYKLLYAMFCSAMWLKDSYY